MPTTTPPQNTPASPRQSVLTASLPSLSPALRRDLLALCLFALATLLLLFPIVLNADRWVLNPGDPLLNAWILGWDVHALCHNVREFFNANIFYPYYRTLAFSEDLLGDLPIALPVIWLTGNALLAHNLVLLLSFVLGGWAMYFTVSRLTGSGWAGLVAGAVYAFNPYRLAHLGHIQLLATQALPLVVYCADRLWVRGAWRHWWALLVLFNLQFLCGYYLGIFMALGLSLLLVGYLLAGAVALNRRLVWQLVLFCALTAALNLPLALPYLTVSRTLGLQRTMEDISWLSARPRAYLLSDPAHWLYGRFNRWAGLRDQNGEQNLFLGLVAWLAVIAGLALTRRGDVGRRRLWVWAGVLGALVVLSWGPELRLGSLSLPLPYRLLFDHVPGFRGIRVPARLIVVVSALVALVGGVGVAQVLRRLSSLPAPRARLLSRSVGAVLCLAVLVESGLTCPPGTIVPPCSEAPEVYKWLATQPPVVTAELPISTNATLQAYTQSTRQYYSLCHWQRTVNGYSGFATSVYGAIGATSQEFPNVATLQWLQGVRVNLLVLHRDLYEDARWEEVASRLPAFGGQLVPVGVFGQAEVLRVALPGWNAGETPPEFGGAVRLVGFTTAVESGEAPTLRLYWQLGRALPSATVRARFVRADGTGRADVQRPLGADALACASWHIGEVYVQKLPVPAGRPARCQLSLAEPRAGQELPIRTGAEALPALLLDL